MLCLRSWNVHSLFKTAKSLHELKVFLKRQTPEPNILYFYGERWASIHHARMRMSCSLLNYDLCYNIHVSDNPSCACSAPFETAQHFFLECPRFLHIRLKLIQSIEHFTTCSLNTILYGCNDLSFKDNIAIFDAVHSYINDSDRFS